LSKIAVAEKSNRVSSKADAQRRADQIVAFREEVGALRREGALPLGDADLASITAHQDRLLEQFAREFDVDRTDVERRMSLGMAIASLFGAGALTAAVVSFVYRMWGDLSTASQVGLVTTAPIAALAVTLVAARVEKTRYVASLFAIVACAAFVLQTVVLAAIFNLRSSPHAVGLFGLFALSVAIPWRLALAFALGAIALAIYVPALAMWAFGVSWTNVMGRPELIGFSAATAAVALARTPSDLTRVARMLLLVLALGVLLLMANAGPPSIWPIDEDAVGPLYQVVSVLVTMALLVIGIRRQSNDVTVLGTLFGGAFLLSRFVDWWWEWMPKYLFFLILAAAALAWLWGLRLARRRYAEAG
jgi:hypothetical protein